MFGLLGLPQLSQTIILQNKGWIPQEEQARKLQDAQAVKLTSLKVDKLKSQPADKIAIIRISCRTRDATLRGVNSQLDIGERDAKDAEDKYPNTVLNFNGDL